MTEPSKAKKAQPGRSRTRAAGASKSPLAKGGSTEGPEAKGTVTREAETRAAASKKIPREQSARRSRSTPARGTPPRAAPARPPATPPEASTRLEGDTDAPDVARTTVSAILEEQARSILEVQGLVKVYGGRSVVEGVSFTVRQGEIIGLLGKNGAGKTTTFRMTIGMITPDEGTIRFSGRDVTHLPMFRRARLGMGYLSQESSVFRGLTVEQNLNAILETTDLSHSERVRTRDELVTEFGLAKLRNSKAAVLSGGEKRRLEIARALITNPKLILLDEPFSGVDPIAVSDIQQIIFRLKERGISILLTDHNVRETLNTTDRSFIILDGRIIAQGTLDEILSDKNAREHYLGEKFKM